ncbi:hypothetical protein DAI22_08g224800 [Oryza sativa Japonica Group]|nr:hypothetical protein DAI22_08g224800 [Oryza sativa Japonica Group]
MMALGAGTCVTIPYFLLLDRGLCRVPPSVWKKMYCYRVIRSICYSIGYTEYNLSVTVTTCA